MVSRVVSRFTVCTVTFNNLSDVKDFLKSIKESKIEVPFNFVIIDNDSSDGCIEYIFKLRKEDIHENCVEFMCYGNGRNKGYLLGINQGIRMGFDSNSEYVIAIDSNIKLHPSCIQSLYNTAEEHKEIDFFTAGNCDNDYLIKELKEEDFNDLSLSCLLMNRQALDKLEKLFI